MDTITPSGTAPRPTPAHDGRAARTAATRAAIMTAAERLYAECGVSAVSNRHVAEVAGQANNTAVAYHFGSKTDLVREIIRRHSRDVDVRRAALLGDARGSSDIRTWLRCLALPSIRHLASLGAPTWYSRFSAQIMADPALRHLIYDDALASEPLQETLQGLRTAAAELPLDVRRTRADMARQLLVHMCSERERALADASPGAEEAARSWIELGTDLVDALTGLWSAPVSR